MIIRGMQGLGDNIYQRAFLSQIGRRLFLETPWPELYKDMEHVKCVRPSTRLRTQLKNVQRQTEWSRTPPAQSVKHVRYGGAGIGNGMQVSLGTRPGPLTLPDFGPSPVDGKYIVVRPVTLRAEWRADSRNPLPEYIASAAAEVRRRGWKVVSVADLEAGKEWALDPLPPADIQFHAGELDVTRLMALVQNASAVIGGIGWIVPAAMAAKVPAWIVCGGQGGFNAPELITAGFDSSCLTFSVPDNFCRCTQKNHYCDKSISNYDDQFARWADRHAPLVRRARHRVPRAAADCIRGRVLPEVPTA